METERIKAALIDGYLDEPSCLGVPPYVSPHIRYIYGALIAGGILPENVDFLTADHYRNQKEDRLANLEEKDLVIILAGTTVPGNYLEGQPLSLAEIRELGERLFYPTLVLTGPITLVWENLPGAAGLAENFDIITGEIGAARLYLRLCEQSGSPGNVAPSHLSDSLKKGGGGFTAEALSRWAIKGAEIFERHPGYPRLLAEIETFRGCPRPRGCSFCSEQLKQVHYQRRPENITAEVREIAEKGIHNYRLGCQTDLLGYTGRSDYRKTGKSAVSGTKTADLDAILAWNNRALKKLYSGIRKADPYLRVLHLDNINPGPLGRQSSRARRSLEIICRYNTPGDVAAFGLESADPEVIRANNIDASPGETREAIRLVNEIGGRRKDGIPKLLPGLNFLLGLRGETDRSYELNLKFLESIKEEGLLLRRINIRQVNPLGSYQSRKVQRSKLLKFKEKVNQKINQPMLRKVFPRGTVIKNVWPVQAKGSLTFGRPSGSYPILIGIPGNYLEQQEMAVQVIDHGYRSITALPYPFYIDRAGLKELTHIPGIGENRARKIILERPVNYSELLKILGPSFPGEEWQAIFQFSSK